MAATGTLICVEDHLRTVTAPDCECVGGVLKQRPMDVLEHTRWQTALLGRCSGSKLCGASRDIPNRVYKQARKVFEFLM